MARDFASSNTPQPPVPPARRPDAKERAGGAVAEERREPESESEAEAEAELDLNAKNLTIRQKVSRFVRRYGFVGVATVGFGKLRLIWAVRMFFQFLAVRGWF